MSNTSGIKNMWKNFPKLNFMRNERLIRYNTCKFLDTSLRISRICCARNSVVRLSLENLQFSKEKPFHYWDQWDGWRSSREIFLMGWTIHLKLFILIIIPKRNSYLTSNYSHFLHWPAINNVLVSVFNHEWMVD